MSIDQDPAVLFVVLCSMTRDDCDDVILSHYWSESLEKQDQMYPIEKKLRPPAVLLHAKNSSEMEK